MVRCRLAPGADQLGRRRCRRRLRRPLRERGNVMPTPTTVSALDVGRIDHAEAMRITATENGRLLDQLRQLTPGDWPAATDCPRWTVRDMVVHLIASAQAQANPAEFARQVWRGRPLTPEIGGGGPGGGGPTGPPPGAPAPDPPPPGPNPHAGPPPPPAPPPP